VRHQEDIEEIYGQASGVAGISSKANNALQTQFRIHQARPESTTDDAGYAGLWRGLGMDSIRSAFWKILLKKVHIQIILCFDPVALGRFVGIPDDEVVPFFKDFISLSSLYKALEVLEAHFVFRSHLQAH
jgi:hypothetical protein